MQASVLPVPTAAKSRFLDSKQGPSSAVLHSNASLSSPLIGSGEDGTSCADSQEEGFRDALFRIGAEIVAGFAAAWSGEYIGEGAGVLIGSVTGTLLPGIGTAAGAALGGLAGEVIGDLGGAVYGAHLGSLVMDDWENG